MCIRDSVGDDRSDEPLDHAGPLPQTGLLVGGGLGGAVEEHLHPDADAQHRPIAGQPHLDDPSTVSSTQPGPAGMEVAHPRDCLLYT